MKEENSTDVSIRKICEWLKCYDIDIFFRDGSKENTFVVRGAKIKPNMIIKYDNKYYFVIAFGGCRSGLILNGVIRILNCYSEFVTKKSEYFIKGKKIKPEGFIIATEFSEKWTLYKYGTIPAISSGYKEFLFHTFMKKADIDGSVGVGILSSIDGLPYIYLINSDENKKWKQNVIRFPRCGML